MFCVAILGGCIFACPAIIGQEANASLTTDEIAQLKAQVAAQQKQLDQLRHTLDAQQTLLNRATSTLRAEEPSTPPELNASPVSLNIGIAKFTPSGFIDVMQV